MSLCLVVLVVLLVLVVGGVPVVGVFSGVRGLSVGWVWLGAGCGVWLFLVFLRMLCLSVPVFAGGGWGCVGVVG